MRCACLCLRREGLDEGDFDGLMGFVSPAGESRKAGVYLAQKLLRVRDRTGRLRPLRANRVQRIFEARRGRVNVVLKARQMGMTTWIAGRFFLKTVSRRRGC